MNKIYVDWNGLEGSSFRLLRSSSPVSGFEKVVENLMVPFFVDDTVNLADEGNRYYYKTEGIVSGVVKATSEVGTLAYNEPDRIAHKVIHEAETVLRMMNNPIVYLLIRKRNAENCPECWNPVTQRSRYADCKTCFGTGNVTGYYPALPARMSMDVPQLVNLTSPVDSDKVGLTPINAWMSNTPLLTPEDVVVDAIDRRYVIQTIIPRTKSQYVIRQVMQMVPLEKGHPTYLMPVDRSVTLR